MKGRKGRMGEQTQLVVVVAAVAVTVAVAVAVVVGFLSKGWRIFDLKIRSEDI
jgi:hypothetical protein